MHISPKTVPLADVIVHVFNDSSFSCCGRELMNFVI